MPPRELPGSARRPSRRPLEAPWRARGGPTIAPTNIKINVTEHKIVNNLKFENPLSPNILYGFARDAIKYFSLTLVR